MRRSVVILCLLLLLIPPFFVLLPPAVQALDGEALLRDTQAALDAGDFSRALTLAEKAVAAMPSSSEAYRMRGNALRSLKNPQAAWPDYERALKLDMRNYRAWAGRAAVRFQLNDLDAAFLEVNKAVELKADYSAGYGIRGDILIAQKRYALAIADLDYSLRLNPQNSGSLLSRGAARYESGDYRGAVEDLNAAERLGNNPPKLYYNRGLARQALKDNGAEQDFTRTMELNHRVAEAYARRGGVRLDRGDAAGARQDLTRALELDQKIDYARQRMAELGGPQPPSTASTDKAGPIPGLAVTLPDLPKPAGDLWSKPSSAQVLLKTDGPSLQLPVPDPAKATAAFPLGEISTTMAGLRALAGPLSPEQEKAWARKWQPFFDYPDPEALKYFRALNPLLQELHGIRGVVNQAAQDFDGAWSEAVVSHVSGDTAGTQTALDEAVRHGHVLRAANTRLDQIQKQAQTLGNPPNPKEARAKAGAWSKKWTILTPAPGPAPSHLAYLWRVMQRENIQLMEDQLYSAAVAYGKKDAVRPRLIWPADEAIWVRWFEAGDAGPEPLVEKPLANSVMYEARDLVKKWFVTPSPYTYEKGEKLLIERVTPREAAMSIGAGKKVVTYGRFPDTAAVAVKPVTPSTPATPGGSTGEKARMEAENKAKNDAIAEKQALITLISRNLARDEAEWNQEKDPKRKEALYLRVLNNKSAIQHERDLIETIRTGEYVHTRTPSDDYCHDLMIVRGVEEMERVGEARRLAVAVDKMTGKADPDQVKQLQDFVARQVTPKELAQGNVEKIRQVAQAVFDSTQGRREQAAAKNLEDAVRFEDYEARAEKVKSRAGLALLVLGIGAPAYAAGAGTVMSVGGTSTAAVTGVSVVYGATTGTIEGGPLEGVKQGVAMAGLPGMVASEMITGYQRGGIVSSGGVVGAIERGTEAFIGGKAVESVAGKIGAYYAERAKTGVVPPAPSVKPGLTVAQMVESQSFQVAKRRAQQEVKAYRSLVDEIAAAKASGASVARMAELEAARIKKAMELNENFLGKRIMKAEGKAARAGKGPAANADLEQNFSQAVETVYGTKVDPLFKEGVKKAKIRWLKKTPGGKWEEAGELEFREFRQGAAGKTANTDRDLGLVQKQNKEGEIYQLFQGDKPIRLTDAEKELQRIYENAYQHAGGSDSRLAMQHVTTTSGLESYKDKVATQLNDPKNIDRIDKGWAGQTAEVLQNKVTHAGTGTGEFAELYKKIDGANQAAKDIEQRLLPVLKSIQAKSNAQKAFEVGQDMDKWRAIQRALANVENDPVSASRQLKVLTGLDSIGEVSDLTGQAFVGAVKLQ